MCGVYAAAILFRIDARGDRVVDLLSRAAFNVQADDDGRFG